MPIPMEFWGVEVKPGQTVRYQPRDDHILHISQAAFGEWEEGSNVEATTVHLKVDDGEKLTIATLSADKAPQVQLDLCIEKGFGLSHTSSTASVFFCGYQFFGRPHPED